MEIERGPFKEEEENLNINQKWTSKQKTNGWPTDKELLISAVKCLFTQYES